MNGLLCKTVFCPNNIQRKSSMSRKGLVGKSTVERRKPTQVIESTNFIIENKNTPLVISEDIFGFEMAVRRLRKRFEK